MITPSSTKGLESNRTATGILILSELTGYATQQLSGHAARYDKDEARFVGIRLGDAYELAVKSWGTDLPDFWKVWNSWNVASDDPKPWGDL